MRHAISVLLENEVGALTRMTGMFSSRGYNIESLNVAPTNEPAVSRVTLVVSGSDSAIAQLNTQLAKLVDVVHAIDHSGDLAYETEIALVKIESPLVERTQILQIAEHFKARVVDFGPESLILQAHGSSEKIDALIDLLRPFRIAELVRSGKLLMARGRHIT